MRHLQHRVLLRLGRDDLGVAANSPSIGKVAIEQRLDRQFVHVMLLAGSAFAMAIHLHDANFDLAIGILGELA